MDLPKRLEKILSLVPNCEVLADVGCDHGMLGVQVLLQKKAKKVIFIDVSNPSLKKAELLAKKYGLYDNCEFVCGDGLCGRNVDCAVIAGMGSKEILKILLESTFLPEHLVLNPMRNTDTLRYELKNKYFFEYDQKLFDKKYYDILYLKKGFDDLSDLQLKYGKTNLEFFCEDFYKFLLEEYKKYDTILNNTQNLEVSLIVEEIKALLNRSKNVG